MQAIIQGPIQTPTFWARAGEHVIIIIVQINIIIILFNNSKDKRVIIYFNDVS